MRRKVAIVALVVGLAVAGCGGGGDNADLEARVSELERQVQAQQQELEEIKRDTTALRELESRIDRLLDELGGIGGLRELLERLGITS
jgi:prefoldin subunit 5